MKIDKIILKNFRNYVDAEISINEKSLVIGPNDVGKTNLMFALRLLLDKKLNMSEIEPQDTDFNISTGQNEFKVYIYFKEATEDCIRSAFRGDISESGEVVLAYFGSRDSNGKKVYQLFQGKSDSEEDLREINGRQYLKYLNLEYVKSTRDLMSFIKSEKNKMFEEAMSNRTDEEEGEDQTRINQIEERLEGINTLIGELSYINSSLEAVNAEITELTPEHENFEISFDAGAMNTNDFLKKLKLVSIQGDDKVELGGDGRNNQVFMSMWSSRAGAQDIESVTIYCIEEPEAHLHPHQQRNLASYLYDRIEGQILISSHSPQIVCEFSPNSLVKLYKDDLNSTLAASGGCSELVENTFFEFNYRLNLLPAECFFSSCVLLVEGPSEVMFYKALAKSLELDLDKLNISVLSVNGIDFKAYYKVLSSLEIPVVVRTDNDIFSRPRGGGYRMSGIRRLKNLLCDIYDAEVPEELIEVSDLILDQRELPSDQESNFQESKNFLEEYDLFLADIDLEWDLVNSNLNEILSTHYGVADSTQLYKKMTGKKGISMFKFIADNIDGLDELSEDSISTPLRKCVEIVEGE